MRQLIVNEKSTVSSLLRITARPDECQSTAGFARGQAHRNLEPRVIDSFVRFID